jgi:hypothetical protein
MRTWPVAGLNSVRIFMVERSGCAAGERSGR